MQSPNHIEGQRSPAVGHLLDAATTTNEGNKIARLKSSDGTRRRPPAPIENGNEHTAPFPAQRKSIPCSVRKIPCFIDEIKLEVSEYGQTSPPDICTGADFENSLQISLLPRNSRMCSSITDSGNCYFPDIPALMVPSRPDKKCAIGRTRAVSPEQVS